MAVETVSEVPRTPPRKVACPALRTSMPSHAQLRFDANKNDIVMLWHIHNEIAGPAHGRKHRVDILNCAGDCLYFRMLGILH